LSIALAARVAAEFRDGVWFAPLAAVSDPSLVPASIAQSIGLQDARGHSLLEHMTSYLADRKVLLILDNFEHVLPAAEFVAELLGASSDLRILVTSRSPLHVSGEQEFAVPPMLLPEPDTPVSAASLADYESAQLFAARAAASLPGFTITGENAEAIAGIVRRLDGLPLAIELAAARVKLLPPAVILTRLVDSLGLLVSGSRDVPDRQRTLRATIAWSFDLLGEPARRLLAACSVFRGGIGLEHIEAVCASTLRLGVPVLDAVNELVDQSLLRLASSSAAVSRYAILETVRDFAAEQLDGLPEHRAGARCPRGGVLGPGQGSRSPTVLAGPGGSRSARARARQFPDGAGLVPRDGSGHGAAPGQPAHRVLVGARALLRRQAAAGRSARPCPIRRSGAGGRADWCGVARDRPGRPCFGPRIARREHQVRPRRARPCPGGRRPELSRPRQTGHRRPDGGRADVERALELQTQAGEGADLAVVLLLAGAAAYFEDDLGIAVERFERCAQLSAAHRPARRRSPGPPAARPSPAWSAVTCKAPRRRSPRVCQAITDIGDRFAIPVGVSALAGLAAKGGRPRAALMLAGAAAAYEEVNQTHRPQKVRTQLDAWLAPIHKKIGASAQKLSDRGRKLTLGRGGRAWPR
jgi:non-specific serine/threonine protein kinase